MVTQIDRTTHRLTSEQYLRGGVPKSLIVLHHTVGGSVKSTFDYWQSDPRRIGTAFLVDRDGTIYEVFPPEDWAYHLGVKDSLIEQRSIGIELCSEGGLTVRRSTSGVFEAFAFDGKRKLGNVSILRSRGQIVKFEAGWRGFTWFDAYEEAQVNATIGLTLMLCQRFQIPARMPTPAECRGPANLRKWYGFQGVLHHAMVRPDKSDLHPGFPFEVLSAALNAVTSQE